MKINFDNRVSYADVLAFLAAGATGLWVVFGVAADIDKLHIEQTYIKEDLIILENRNALNIKDVSLAVDKLRKDTKESLKDLEEKSQARHDKAMAKLDALVDREIEMLMKEKD